MYLLALEWGIDFVAVFADTGHEHQYTYDYVRNLPALTGGPEIRWIKADFSAEIGRKRMFIARDRRTVFDMHRRHNIEPNPLYSHGCSRVGCMLCIHARKHEIQSVSKYFPDQINRMEEWERRQRPR